MDGLTEAEWFGHGFKDYPPAPGDFMDLPSGGTFMGDLSCNRAFTAMRSPVYGTQPYPEYACRVSRPAAPSRPS